MRCYLKMIKSFFLLDKKQVGVILVIEQMKEWVFELFKKGGIDMSIDNYTKKSLEVIENCERLA